MDVACEVEFVGGPIDGLSELLVLPLKPFLGVTVVADDLPTAPLARLVQFLCGYKQTGPIPLAVYELTDDHEATTLCYRYRGSHAVPREHFHGKSGAIALDQRLSEAN